MTVLATEVALTRAFSVLLRFHYVFLAVSLATCGLGLGGLVDHFLRRLAGRGVLAASGLFCAVGGPAGMAALFATPLSARLTSLWVISLCCLPGFIAAGVFLSRAFTLWGRHSGLLYFADLTGAAVAAAGVIILLQYGGAVNAAFWCASLAAFAAALVGRRPLVTAPALVLGGALLFLGLANLSARWVDLPALRLANDPLAKPLYQELGDPRSGARLIHSEWNAFARTDVVVYADPVTGRIDPDGDLYVYTDGEVPTNIVRYKGDLRELAERYKDFIGLYAFRAVMPNTALLMGPGGGLDIWLGLLVGCQRMDGAEINPSMPRLVRAYRDFAGPVYDFEGVDIKVAEGRSFVRQAREQYDIIYMALTKTATTATASMALVESYVYTTEAFRDYYRRLSDAGAVAFVCQSPWLLVRQMLTALVALEAEGLSRAEALDCLGLVSVPPEQQAAGPYRHLMLMFRRPQGVDRWQSLAKMAVASNLLPVFFPRCYEPEPFSLLRDARLSLKEFVRVANELWLPGGRGLNFVPCPDDRPFVVDLTWGVPGPLKSFMGGMAALLLFICAAAPGAVPGFSRPRWRLAWLVYFAALGVAFMLVEIALIHTFTLYLGYPVLSLATLVFGILLGAGVGSRLSQGVEEERAVPAVGWVVVALAVLSALLLATAPALFAATLSWDVRVRSLVTLAAVVPLGMLMGVPFPSGIRAVVSQIGPAAVPWLWAVNGVASVIGSSAAMALAKIAGFRCTIAVGLIIYVVAAALMALARRRNTVVGK
ncbi:MAG: hypothetical protein N2512_04450 [Armatimonadetes bacterium]|nr:hypothetical protein [Armatimonadota bacterium]